MEVKAKGLRNSGGKLVTLQFRENRVSYGVEAQGKQVKYGYYLP
jgi:hypothetical protein